MPVTSMALEKWRGARAELLDELLDAHARVGGTGPGRRYRTQQLNLSADGNSDNGEPPRITLPLARTP